MRRRTENSNELKKHRFHHHKKYTLIQYPSTSRIEAYSDGVIAIIVTIMVLELKVPELAATFTHEAFLQAAAHLAPKLLAYAMSFIIVSIFWVNHHNFYHSLVKSDGKLLWYNNLLLFWLSLIPFSTAFLGEHPLQVEAIMVFGGILFMAGISFPLMGYYAMFKGDLIDESFTIPMRWRVFRSSLPGVILYAASIAVAPFSPWTAWVIFFIVPMYYFIPYKLSDEL